MVVGDSRKRRGRELKIVTLQSVPGARLKIAAFGMMTHSVTCIVALLKRRGSLLTMGTVASFAFVGQARFRAGFARRQCGLSPHPYEESEVRI